MPASMMRRVVLAALAAAALALALVAGACGGDDAPAPRLVLGGGTFDLGVIKIGQPAERAIDFRNGGTEPLEVSIVKVRPAPDAECGCGVDRYEVRPGTVEAGAAGQLVFHLKAPEGMADMQDKMLAELESNDPGNASLTISLVFRMAP